MTDWSFIERVVVRNLGGSFIGEARTHAEFVTGAIHDTPQAAFDSAAAAMTAKMAPRYRKPAAQAPDEFEDLL